MKRLFGRVAPVCGQTGGKAVRLSDTKKGPLYHTRELGSLFGKENVLAMWHRGHTCLKSPVAAGSPIQEDNKVTLSVKYLTEEQRARYEVTVEVVPGTTVKKLYQGGKPLTTDGALNMWAQGQSDTYIFVMDELGRIYAADGKREYAAHGLGQYFRDCDKNLFDAVTTGIPLRSWVQGPPVDHYATVSLSAAVPCSLAIPGGALGSTAPAEEDAKWLRKLARTPHSATSVASLIVQHPREAPKKAEPKPDATLYPQAQAQPETFTGTGSPDVPTDEGNPYAFVQESFFAPSSTNTSSTPEPLRYSSPISSESSDDAPPIPVSSLGPLTPITYRKRRREVDEGQACLKTIRPGQGIFVVTVPRAADGTIDVTKLEKHADEWATIQKQRESAWQVHENEAKTAHEQRQVNKRKEHDEAQQSLPEAQRTAYVEKPFVPVPFVAQPYPGDPSEAPMEGGWVCRNCYERRAYWPVVQHFKLDAAKVRPLYDAARDETKIPAHSLRLFNSLKPLLTPAQAKALEPYSSAKAPTKIEVFHHSSFLAGKPVAAAGEISCSDGYVTTISNQSGHYLPPGWMLKQVLTQLGLQGLHISENKLSFKGNEGADARSSSSAHGSQDDILSDLRGMLERGVKLSPIPRGPRVRGADQPILCEGLVEPDAPCKETSATVDFMDYVDEKWLCRECIDHVPAANRAARLRTGQKA